MKSDCRGDREMPSKKLSNSFYRHHDVLFISQQLLGKFLFSRIDGILTGGMIIETEAYRGIDDKASHAYGNRRTKRTEVMYQAGGICYVYLCYGLHALLNVVTNNQEHPHAILIRALQPTVGIDHMLLRRKKKRLDSTLTSGPGSLTQALGITVKHNGTPLNGSLVWIEDRNVIIKPNQIIASPRVGIDYAGEDAFLPWRFRLKLPAN
jgi:DNA-3-methyladenine glycosylase